jgi:hypothetical protein
MRNKYTQNENLYYVKSGAIQTKNVDCIDRNSVCISCEIIVTTVGSRDDSDFVSPFLLTYLIETKKIVEFSVAD